MNKTTTHRFTKRLHLSLIAALLVVVLGVSVVLVAHADPGTITIKKQTVPPGGMGFEFTHNITPTVPSPFYLDDGQQQKFLQVDPGTYTITETNPAVIPGGWILTSIDCVDEKGITWGVKQVASTTVIISSTRETVECIFTNVRPSVVGGYVIPVNKLELLVPWLGLVALASFAALTVALVRRLISA